MAGEITDLSPIAAIDRTNDLLEIVDVSANQSDNVTPNNLMGITSGNALSTTDSQTVQNKTLDNTNSITVKAANFVLEDGSDTTKQAKFVLSGITTGNTRAFTLPDTSDTIVVLAASQTLTNKTLTSPTITGGTIDNATVTVDSVAGHTTSNTGTIYGISITTGKITTAGSIASGALATNAVQAAALATNAIELGYTTITSTSSSFSASDTEVTGLATTVTVPAGGRDVEVAVDGGFSYAIAATNAIFKLWDGAVGSGTLLRTFYCAFQGTGGVIIYLSLKAKSAAPSAGSHTYRFSMATDGTHTVALYADSSGGVASMTVKAM